LDEVQAVDGDLGLVRPGTAELALGTGQDGAGRGERPAVRGKLVAAIRDRRRQEAPGSSAWLAEDGA